MNDLLTLYEINLRALARMRAERRLDASVERQAVHAAIDAWKAANSDLIICPACDGVGIVKQRRSKDV